MSDVFTKLALFCYFVATLNYLLLLMSEKYKDNVGKIATGATAIGLVAHGTALVGLAHKHGHMPFSSARASFSFYILVVVLIYLLVETKYQMKIFGSFALPLVLLASIYDLHLPQEIEPLISYNKGLFLAVHVSLAFIGFASFSFAVCTSIMYLMQDNQLKSKHPGRLSFKLPPLEFLDKLSYKSISIGFPVFTIAVILGLVWALSTRASITDWKFREIWWFCIWVAYAILLQARMMIGWRGRRAAYVAICVFVLACVPLFI